MIYFWKDAANFLNRDIGMYNRDCSPDRFLLTDGRILSSEEFHSVAIVDFEVKKERLLQFDCLASNANVPLVNNRVKAILENIAPNDVQFFEAKLVCKDSEINNYYFLNATHSIKGIDHDKSIYTKLKSVNTFNDFYYLTYQPGCMQEHQIARDKEYLMHLLVSDKVRAEFMKEHVTGIDFIRPEDYYYPITIHDLLAEEARLKAEELMDDD